MKTAYYVIAALALATAGAAFGAEQAAASTAAAATTAAASTAAAPAQPAPPAPRGLTRAEVRAQVIEARRNGTLIETEADMDVARTKQQVAR